MTQPSYLAELAQALSRSASKTLQAVAVWRTGTQSAFKYYLDGLDLTHLTTQALDLVTKVDRRFGEVALVTSPGAELHNGLPKGLTWHRAGLDQQVPDIQVTNGVLHVMTRALPRVAHGYLIESRNQMGPGGAALHRLSVLTSTGDAYEMLFSHYDKLAPASIPVHLPESQRDRAWAGRATADLDRLRMANLDQGLLVTAGFNAAGEVVLHFGDSLSMPAETAPKSASKRGGAGRGQGRKPLVPGQRSVSTTVRLPETLREKYRRLGGSEWMRRALEAAPEPAGV